VTVLILYSLPYLFLDVTVSYVQAATDMKMKEMIKA